MRTLVAAAALAALLTGAAAAQEQDVPPPACRENVLGQVDYAACAAAAAPNTPWRTLSLINLGTDAFLRGDYSEAARFYDEAQPTNGGAFISDPLYHAYRASTLQVVGRADEAIVEARRSLSVLSGETPLPPEALAPFSQPENLELVLAALLPVLHAANAPETAAVRDRYLSLPARDWVSWANRAGVLVEIGEVDAAERASAEALRLQPAHPAVLNNHCYILGRAGRAGEALPYCERARDGAPNVGAVRHSLASVLALLGRCEDMRREMAEARRLDPASVEYQTDPACPAA